MCITGGAIDEKSLVSIIIPFKEMDQYTKGCVEYCKRLDYENYEIILLPDNALEDIDGVRVIPTSCITPGAKRNIGIANSNGEVCAFIDSDAYPRRDWLSNAVKYFDDPRVAAVGGPGLTPQKDGFMQKVSGCVLSSFAVGGISSRYKAEKSVESDDIHSCNFIARESVLGEVGGWNEKYWPGEDTLICLAIKKLGKRLIEASDVVVYHHRKPMFEEHLRQVSRFGLHRGFFAKMFKGNSLRVTYFLPSLLVLSLLASVFVLLINPFLVDLVLSAVAIYLALCLVAAFQEIKDAKGVLSVWLGIIATHIVYGVSFLVGLMRRDLKR